MEAMHLLDAAGNEEEATSPTAMVMNWRPRFQSIAFGETEFSHNGPIETHPSHDLAHLFVAASGNMPWAPEGDDGTIRIAEYNAILLEGIMSKTFAALLTRRLKDDDPFTEAVTQMTEFVEESWAPFPITAEEAFCQFAQNVDVEAIIRLSPYFFRMKLVEAKDPEFHLMEWTLSADAMMAPEIEGPVERKYVHALRQQFSKLKTTDPAVIFKGPGTPPAAS